MGLSDLARAIAGEHLRFTALGTRTPYALLDRVAWVRGPFEVPKHRESLVPYGQEGRVDGLVCVREWLRGWGVQAGVPADHVD
jgi:hypothetical protein